MASESNSRASHERKEKYEDILKERDQLKQKVEELEFVNQKLKKSVTYLSDSLSSQSSNCQNYFNFKKSFVGDKNVKDASSRRIGLAIADTGDVADLDFSENENESDDRKLSLTAEIKGHAGAVYTGSFSPNGQLVATGGLDKTVRVWELRESNTQVLSAKPHRQLVSSVSWFSDGKRLLSGSFDSTITLHDIEQRCTVTADSPYQFKTMVQVVETLPNSPQIAFVCGGRHLGMVDFRQPSSSIIYAEEPTPNNLHSIYVPKDEGNSILVQAADRSGRLFTWDFSLGGKLLEEQTISLFDPGQKSHVAQLQIAPSFSHDAANSVFDRMMVASCYDNSIRVFYRTIACPLGTMHPPELPYCSPRQKQGFFKDNTEGVNWGIPELISQKSGSKDGKRTRILEAAVNDNAGTPTECASIEPILPTAQQDKDNPANSQWQLLHTLNGHQSKNWPIGCSIYRGQENTLPQNSKSEGLNKTPVTHRKSAEQTSSCISATEVQPSNKFKWEQSLLLAAGSGEGVVYIYDLANQGRFFQDLRGHEKRVYTLQFHYDEPKLLSTSADSTVRIWSLTSRDEPNRSDNLSSQGSV